MFAATDEVDLEQFLKRLEKLELTQSGASQFYLNDTYQSLLWSDNSGYHELAFAFANALPQRELSSFRF